MPVLNLGLQGRRLHSRLFGSVLGLLLFRHGGGKSIPSVSRKRRIGARVPYSITIALPLDVDAFRTIFQLSHQAVGCSSVTLKPPARTNGEGPAD